MNRDRREDTRSGTDDLVSAYPTHVPMSLPLPTTSQELRPVSHTRPLSPSTPELPAPRAIAVDPADAAAMLGVSRATIYNLLASGQIRSVKIGRSRRISVTELQRLMQTAGSITEPLPVPAPAAEDRPDSECVL